jgi:hypothetical protein
MDEVLVVVLVMVQSSENPIMTVRAQRWSSKRCQEEKEDVRSKPPEHLTKI